MITRYNDFLYEGKKYTPEDFGITDYEIVDGKLACYGDVSIECTKFKKLHLKFKVVQGNFSCSENELTTLEGCPEIVGLTFYCNHNKLTSLMGGPKTIGHDYKAHGNKLTNLIGAPEKVTGYFSVYDNELSSLEGFPKIVRYTATMTNKRNILTIEDYPIGSDVNWYLPTDLHFNDINKLVKEYEDLFRSLENNKTRFHQQVMRMRPDLIKYYTPIQKPPIRTII